MTPPDVMTAAGAWAAGAQAARAADVSELRRLAGGHSAAVRWYCAETTAASPEWSERADYEARASATLQGAGDALAALPLPPPPQTAPAPPQSPLPSPDGGTGPQGDGAPAGGCGVAEAYVEAAVVCERMAQAHDRLAAVADSEGAERRQREAAGVLRCAADRIRALAGGP